MIMYDVLFVLCFILGILYMILLFCHSILFYIFESGKKSDKGLNIKKDKE